MANNTSNTIASTLGISSYNDAIEKIKNQIKEVDPDGHDYNFLREKLHTIINEASDVMSDALEIAKMNQSDKGYTAAANLVKSVVDAAKVLAEINSKKEDIKRLPEATKKNDTYFVGGTLELQRMIKNLKQNG
jgi:ribonuclease D